MANIYVRSGASGANNGTSKTDAYTTLGAAATGSAAGDTIYVASDHAETQATANTITFPGTASSWNRIICVNFAGSTPPVSADITTGATVSTTSTSSIELNGYFYCEGVAFVCGDGSGSSSFTVIATGNGAAVMKNGSATLRGTGVSAPVIIGATGTNSHQVEFDNFYCSFASTSQFMSLRNTRFEWRRTSSPIQGSIPTELFKTSSRAGSVELEGLDLSAAGSGKTLIGANSDPVNFYLKDCKLNASVTVASTPAAPGAGETYVTRSDSGSTNYKSAKYSFFGTETTDTALIRTGGASTGVTGFAQKYVSTSGAAFHCPFKCLPFTIYNSTTGASVTVTVEGVWNSASLPNNDEFWIDIEALGTSGYPLGTYASGAKATVLASASALTASTQAWDGNVTSRANSTAYSLGDIRKVASNSGRVFFCTTAGTSAGSEPGGYASAVDGGSVTDGTAVFRAGRRFKTAVSITPQLAGDIYVYPKVGLASATFWIDPKPVLS